MICVAAVVCLKDLCRCSSIGVCRGGVSVSDLWCRNIIGVCRVICVKSECPTRVSTYAVLQECQIKLSYKSVK